jgi:hypothetical protein
MLNPPEARYANSFGFILNLVLVHRLVGYLGYGEHCGETWTQSKHGFHL